MQIIYSVYNVYVFIWIRSGFVSTPPPSIMVFIVVSSSIVPFQAQWPYDLSYSLYDNVILTNSGGSVAAGRASHVGQVTG
jgi:hypothetical protein